MENREVFNITWQGIEVEIVCREPAYMNSHRKFYGCGMFRIEIRSISPKRAPLPITETGYKSIFMTEPELAKQGGSLKYVTSYIEQEAKSKKWQKNLENSRQFNLF
ncbi:MAG: hypothetical protein JKX83_03355 [Pseudomonadales bacterium]|nr:hypothetical protein [Pseudomonadales bacterium]